MSFVAIDGSTAASAEIYDPSTGQFTPAGAMQVKYEPDARARRVVLP